MKTINITIPLWVNILILITALFWFGNTKISFCPFILKADWKKILSIIFISVGLILWTISAESKSYEKGFKDGAKGMAEMILKENEKKQYHINQRFS